MVPLSDLSQSIPLGFVIALFSLYVVVVATYRLYLSPLAKFPGSKLAAVTLWYEFYYDVIKRGRFAWEIERMHQKYGPIIRINPYELHINDPEFYDELYSGPTKKRDKWEWSAKMFGNSKSMLGTVSHDHHRLRRAALNPYFSKQSVARLEPVIKSKIERLCTRLEGFRKSREPVNMELAYMALTTDIITEYSFAKSYEFLAKQDFSPQWLQLQMSISEASLLNKQFPWILPLMKASPIWLVEKMNPQMMQIINFQMDLEAQLQAIIRGENISHKTAEHPTMFHELLGSDLPAPEKSLDRLIDEAQTVVAAGSITTAHFLKTTTYHLLANPKILQKLKAELVGIMPNPSELPAFRELERLPYLNAVVNEGFRLTYGVASRLTRVAPDTPLKFHEWVIPAGTPVSMSSMLQHRNPQLFPEPNIFKPERWLDTIQGKQHLDKYLVNFSKGTRMCLGMNLARAEIFFTIPAVVRRFEMELYETDRSDVDIVHDFFNPSARLDSKGMRVVVK